jgi:membrane dipeptidase
MTLVHQHTNGWADSASDVDDASIAHHGGLSDFGKAVVQRMNDLGVAVDVSHASDATFWDALAASRVPVMASHSSVRALAPSPRNLTDEMLRAVAANGGIVMVNFADYYLDPRKVERGAQVWFLLTHPRSWQTPLAMLADHVEHVVRVAGVDHVGLGSDFDGVPFLPERMKSVADLPNLTEELLRRGWSDGDLRKLLGENALRVLEAAERAAVPVRPSE